MNNEKGTITEYALILMSIVLVCFIALAAFGSLITGFYADFVSILP